MYLQDSETLPFPAVTIGFHYLAYTVQYIKILNYCDKGYRPSGTISDWKMHEPFSPKTTRPGTFSIHNYINLLFSIFPLSLAVLGMLYQVPYVLHCDTMLIAVKTIRYIT